MPVRAMPGGRRASMPLGVGGGLAGRGPAAGGGRCEGAERRAAHRARRPSWPLRSFPFPGLMRAVCLACMCAVRPGAASDDRPPCEARGAPGARAGGLRARLAGCWALPAQAPPALRVRGGADPVLLADGWDEAAAHDGILPLLLCAVCGWRVRVLVLCVPTLVFYLYPIFLSHTSCLPLARTEVARVQARLAEEEERAGAVDVPFEVGSACEEYGAEFGEGQYQGGDDETLAGLQAELEEVERELEDAQDARAVAEQVNVRLKSAMEEQSLEIVRLRGLLGSMGVNATGDWSTPATDASRKTDANAAYLEQIEKLRDMLSSKMDQARTLLQEKERAESDLLLAQREVGGRWDVDVWWRASCLRACVHALSSYAFLPLSTRRIPLSPPPTHTHVGMHACAECT